MTVFHDHNDDSSTNEGYYERVPKNQLIFDEEFGLIRQKRRKTSMVVKNKLANWGRENRINSKFILDFIPILKWLPKYNIKGNLVNDIIGGLTVGIMHVPQGMAYSSLAGVKPVNGLYTSLFPAIFYMIFGTSRHVSLGVFAVVSLLVGSCNLRVTNIIHENIVSENSTLLNHDDDALMAVSISVVTSLTMLVGIMQVRTIKLTIKLVLFVITIVFLRIPLPKIPDISLFHYFIQDAVAISIVSLVVTISMGKLFAKKHNYDVDVRQEFYAMGFTELLSSLFPVWPSSTALARTLVYEAAGTKTQLATIFSSLLLLSVVYFIGPFVEVLPTCFLSCIIIVALKGMFMQLCCIPTLWSVSKSDCAIFFISFIATVLYDVVEGLMIGMLFALGVVIYNIQSYYSARIVEIGRLSHSEGQAYFQPVEKYRDATVRSGVCCVRFSAPLIYLNAERFKKSIEEVIKLPISAKKRKEEDNEKEKSLKLSRNSSGSTLKSKLTTHESIIQTQISTTEAKNALTSIRTVVIDMSSVPNVDYTGAHCLIDIFNEQRKSGISLYFAAVPLAVLTTLETIPKMMDSGMIACFYPSIEDALNNVGITTN
uniref:STAS domain-containing protein n=1 Tax=Heterorhabditis bacteriophora TaxID=37862 RepID=A0A1I7WX07_HETBA